MSGEEDIPRSSNNNANIYTGDNSDSSSAAEKGGGSRDNCPEASKKLKLFCSVICCNDIKVKFRRRPVSISCPGPCSSSRRPWIHLLALFKTEFLSSTHLKCIFTGLSG